MDGTEYHNAKQIEPASKTQRLLIFSFTESRAKKFDKNVKGKLEMENIYGGGQKAR
jgi:hypothetical protein